MNLDDVKFAYSKTFKNGEYIVGYEKKVSEIASKFAVSPINLKMCLRVYSDTLNFEKEKNIILSDKLQSVNKDNLKYLSRIKSLESYISKKHFTNVDALNKHVVLLTDKLRFADSEKLRLKAELLDNIKELKNKCYLYRLRRNYSIFFNVFFILIIIFS